MRKGFVTLAAVALSCAGFALAQSGNDLYQQAQKKVCEERDYEGAIQIYDRILKDFVSDRAMVGRATLARLRAKEFAGMVESRKGYEQMVRDFSDQPTIVDEARKRLASAGLPAPASGIYIAGFDQRTGKVHGPVERITRDCETLEAFPAWSPDNKTIAFKSGASTNNMPPNVVLRSMETGQDKQYPQARPGMNELFWLNDNSGITFLSERMIYGMNTDGSGGKQRDFPFNPFNGNFTGFFLALAPDAKTLFAYGVTQNGPLSTSAIMSLDFATWRDERVLSLPTPPAAGARRLPGGLGITSQPIDLSPDGRTLAVLTNWFAGREVRLSTINVDGSNYQEHEIAADSALHIVWSRDGRRLVYSSCIFGTLNCRLMQMPVTGGPPEFTGLQTTSFMSFDFSGDGSKIAFSAASYTLNGPAGLKN